MPVNRDLVNQSLVADQESAILRAGTRERSWALCFPSAAQALASGLHPSRTLPSVSWLLTQGIEVLDIVVPHEHPSIDEIYQGAFFSTFLHGNPSTNVVDWNAITCIEMISDAKIAVLDPTVSHSLS